MGIYLALLIAVCVLAFGVLLWALRDPTKLMAASMGALVILIRVLLLADFGQRVRLIEAGIGPPSADDDTGAYCRP